MISPIVATFDQALRQGDLASAARIARARLEQAPEDAGAWHLLGHVCDARQLLTEAESAFERAHQLEPKLIGYRFSLGGQRFSDRDWIAAERHFLACIKARPTWLDAWSNLARTRLKSGNPKAAWEAAQRASELDPKHIGALQLLAVCCEWAQAPSEALIDVRQRIVAQNPNDPDAHFLLAMAHWSARHFRETHAHLQHCLYLDAEHLSALWVATQLPQQSPFETQQQRDTFLKNWRAGMMRIESLNLGSERMRAHCEAVMQLPTNFSLAYLGGALRAEQASYARAIESISARVCAPTASPPRRITRTRRRIGVISGMLQQHTVSKLFMPLFLSLDRSRFSVSGFCPRNQADDWSARFRAQLDEFHLGSASPQAWAKILTDADLDVLIYLDIGMYPLCSSLASLRLAPVQGVLWGHPISTGLKNMDWFISSEAMEPDDFAEHYSEQVMRLPGIGCGFEPPVIQPDRAMRERLPRADGLTRAACLQSVEKLSPQHDVLFAQLLQRVPKLQLSLTPGLTAATRPAFIARLRAVCAAHAVDFDSRVTVHERLSQAEFAAVTEQQDFVLDSFDWSGGVTALETFWLDKPIVTLPGALMRGRHTAGMLAQMGLNELIASSSDHYLDIALRLANDEGWRKQLSARVAAEKHVLYAFDKVRSAFSTWLSDVQPDVFA